ncbi:MAG: carbohydrate kinase family protein [Thermomicrobiales bacterium]|nr:carbohydrate kinase family protein [Thermomicrobiales bacterium]
MPQPQSQPNVVVSGSIAFDYIMTFPGSFKDHILPDKVHVLSVSFLFDSLQRLRGGVGGNIAYNLALLGERPVLVGAGGADFGEYRAAFEALGLDTSAIVDAPNLLTGSSFMSTDLAGNQIAGFYPGASEAAAALSVADLARGAAYGIVGATTLEAMRRHAAEIAATGCRLIYDPSQQVVALPAEDLAAGIVAAWAVIGSDYEFAMMERKTGLTVADIAERVPVVAVTFGGEGSTIHIEGRQVAIPTAAPERVEDPTGAGDAYRAGLIKGFLLEAPPEIAGRMAAVAATYAIERHGTQEHCYAPEGFVARFDSAFPEFAGNVTAEALAEPVARR